MRRLLILFTIILILCNCLYSQEISVTDRQKATKTAQLPIVTIGKKIQGDFDGDGQTEFAMELKTKKGHGNPVEDGIPDEYEMRFSNHKLKSISAGCCDFLLINEGDLNGDGADEISIYQSPMNGCTYLMRTYSFIKGHWKEIVGMFLIPTACDSISDENLQKRIFRENNEIYYYDTDSNGQLVKKKVKKN